MKTLLILLWCFIGATTQASIFAAPFYNLFKKIRSKPVLVPYRQPKVGGPSYADTAHYDPPENNYDHAPPSHYDYPSEPPPAASRYHRYDNSPDYYGDYPEYNGQLPQKHGDGQYLDGLGVLG